MVTMDIKEHYKKLFKTYGDTHHSAQWSSLETQEKRFEILTQISNINYASVLDYGCGTGHLATYLNKENIQVQYTGVDIVEEMIECATLKHPNHRFYLEEQLGEFEEKFDYIFISGVFNNKINKNTDYYQSIIKKLVPFARKGIAFNMLSSYVDYYDQDLFYEKPETVIEFIKNEISPFMIIRNDYQLKENTIPFEFTVYIYFK